VWLSGEQKAIKLFQDTSKDIYVEMAKLIFNNPNLTKKDKADYLRIKKNLIENLEKIQN